MLILLKMFIVLALMVFLLKKKTPFGHAMLSSTLLLLLITAPTFSNFFTAFQQTIIKPGTWSMLLTLYFVMGLEHLLRTSGILKDFTASARRLFGSDRVLLGFMPAFLGFLPSLGGAIFSAPLVKEAGERYGLSPERLTAINYWFRHVWEFSNPILPALLLASQLTKIPVSTLIAHMFIYTVAAAVIGTVVLLTGKAYRNPPKEPPASVEQHAIDDVAFNNTGKALRSIFLAAGPIFVNLFLVVVFHMNTALALGLVVFAMTLILKFDIGKIKAMLLSSLDFQIHWGVFNILFFQQMLETTGTINQIVSVFETSGISAMTIISLLTFIIGILVGSPQGFVAVAFPLVLPLAQGSLDVVALSYIAGLFGAMLSPAHLCQIVTLEYFKADYVKSLLPILFMEILLLLFGMVTIFVF